MRRLVNSLPKAMPGVERHRRQFGRPSDLLTGDRGRSTGAVRRDFGGRDDRPCAGHRSYMWAGRHVFVQRVCPGLAADERGGGAPETHLYAGAGQNRPLVYGWEDELSDLVTRLTEAA